MTCEYGNGGLSSYISVYFTFMNLYCEQHLPDKSPSVNISWEIIHFKEFVFLI